jgi:branched-chain amino acid transport system permease protein
MDIFIQQLLNGIILGCMYALVALGYTMVYGVLNLINFAHGEILMIGALSGLTIITAVDALFPGLPGGVLLAAAILGMLIERIAYRPLRGAARLAPLTTAIGMSILLQALAMMVWGRGRIPFPSVLPMDSVDVFGVLITPTQIVLIVLAVLAMTALVILVEKTRIGRAMRATAENPSVAGLMGVDANRVVVMTFVIGAALAAIAGVMWAANYSTAHATMGMVPGLKAFAAAVLGGIGNIYGAMLGGMLLGLIESLGAGYLGDFTHGVFGSNYQDIFAFMVLIIVLTLRPSGMMGERLADRA